MLESDLLGSQFQFDLNEVWELLKLIVFWYPSSLCDQESIVTLNIIFSSSQLQSHLLKEHVLSINKMFI